MKKILSVDIGTTSAKAMVVGEDGAVLASAREFYSTSHPTPDFAEQNPDEIFRGVVRIIRETAGAVGGQVEGVCLSSAMHSLMAITEHGEARTALITWADLRSRDESRALREGQWTEIYRETGTPIHPMTPLCKLLWLRKNRPELFDGTTRFIGIKEYIWYKIFHEFVVDHSIASATGLFDIARKSWAATALALTGVSAAQLSTPRSVYTMNKLAAGPMQKDLGLHPAVPWILGASDGCLANLGSGAMDDDTLALTIGTSGAVRKVVRQILPDPGGRTFHYLLDEETYVTGGATNNGAILVQWFSEKFLKEPVDLKIFGARAATVAPGSEGLIFLPYVLGERAPVFDPDASGVFMGVRQHHTTEHFMRAILEGVAYALYSIAHVVEENSGGYKKVQASGGFVKCDPWVQIVADVFGSEVCVSGLEDASAVGAALMGFQALGIQSHFQFPSEKDYHPSSFHKIYSRGFSVYKNLYLQLSDNFHLLSKIDQN